MSRCVIIGGAEIREYDLVRSYFRSDDRYYYCDSGLLHKEALGAPPTLIIGDFDSHPKPDLPVETIVLPCEKDDTDTVYAVREALFRGMNEFLLIGVTGQRLDHTLGNVSILLWLDALEKQALIADDYGEMTVVSRRAALIPDSFAWFSLLNISGTAAGITVRNAKYPLENATIDCEYQYGISNEVLPGKTAEVSVGEGRLLLIKIRK